MSQQVNDHPIMGCYNCPLKQANFTNDGSGQQVMVCIHPNLKPAEQIQLNKTNLQAPGVLPEKCPLKISPHQVMHTFRLARR